MSIPAYRTQMKNLSSDILLPVRIAYFITVHNNPAQFIKMFEKLYNKNQIYLIHIDRKSSAVVTEVIQMYLIKFSNVYLLESTYIMPGGFSIVQAELNAMQFLLNVNDKWDYFINLSGDHYPLKSQYAICNYLSKNLNKNYLFYYDQNLYRPDTLKRIQHYFSELNILLFSTLYKRDFMKGMTPYIGGKWFIFTRDTCAFLCYNSKVEKFIKFYSHTYLPAESFFQTVLLNTSFGGVIVNNDKRAVYNKNNNQELFMESLKANNKLFVRKIDVNTDKRVYEYIEKNFYSQISDSEELNKDLGIRDDQQN